MSDDIVKETTESILASKSEYDDLRQKQEALFKNKVNHQYDEMIKRKEVAEKAKKIDLSFETQAKEISITQQESDDYLILAKQGKIFLNNEFKNAVPMFPKNLILIGAKSGDGKSTTSANISYNTAIQKGRVLVITNEEHKVDVYNRITCLHMGWAYINHDQFTEAQRGIFRKAMEIWFQRVTVIDDSYNNGTGCTTTIEGIQSILESLIIQKIHYDVIIIDYYQNISHSVLNPYLQNWEVQMKLASYLDQFKNRYMAPIIILAQLQASTDKERIPYKQRIEGSKQIYNRATCAIEMMAEREQLRTGWVFKKTRFSEAIGKTIYTGYDKGKFVPYTSEFSAEVLRKMGEKQYKQQLSKAFSDNKNT